MIIFLQFITIALILLLLIKSISHDSRVDKLERFVRKSMSQSRQAEISEELTKNIFSSIVNSDVYSDIYMEETKEE
jgi:hypothetical protein